MPAWFGHRRGAFTDAGRNRAGLLQTADVGVVFLDEIGDLGLVEQAMLLGAVEDRELPAARRRPRGTLRRCRDSRGRAPRPRPAGKQRRPGR